VTEAILDAGYGSSGRFYAEADAVLGMAPRTFRAGGADATIRFATRACTLGKVLVAATDAGVCAVLIGDDPTELRADLTARFPRARLVAGDAAFAETVAAVVAHVEEPRRALALPLDLRGTAFQQRVWAALRRVPSGQTVSYAELARAIGSPAAVRAVAGACASNPVAVVVPCHRVVRSDGGLSGYRWGVERKRALLERERRGS
jgi:AraC family transcriptional regulator of adaptative response/methylated-DNA-[protein]-cysteine methyltransferase